jgi:hypothetical protein
MPPKSSPAEAGQPDLGAIWGEKSRLARRDRRSTA